MHSNYFAETCCLIVNSTTDNIPHQRINKNSINIPSNINLADPNFNVSAQIDILIGAALFFDLLCIGKIKLNTNGLAAHKTKVGWIVSGQVFNLQACDDKKRNTTCCLTTDLELNNNLKKFWEIEENVNDNQVMSKEELECEHHFIANFEHDQTGRYIVKLPTRENYSELGDSLATATKRFYSIENKLSKNTELKNQYTAFMKEYEDLGHMTQVNPESINNNVIFYLPHHSVLKVDSSTTKLRVVFDASAKTSSGLSLNDVLKVGPTIQSDLFSILLRFRQHNIVLIADIAKMYRQVNVHTSQRDMQRIVWRDDPASKLHFYTLNTVTYGTAPASFLATRCLKQTALENLNEYPRESSIILTDFYVDDLLTGAENIDELIVIRKNISSILSSVGFELRQFMSNKPEVLQDLNVNSENTRYIIRNGDITKALGVAWKPASDTFEYNVCINQFSQNTVTKRTILSYISQIFDPLGLLSVVIIQAKFMIQRLWQLQIGWDEVIPPELYTAWENYYQQLKNITLVSIPRAVIIQDSVNLQIHGFCDASMKAYGAAIYVRSQDNNGTIQVRLLCAKSRVAPVKTISLPRLELCGALLLSKLLSKVIQTLSTHNQINSIFYWTDSTIVLSWLSAEPQVWKTFIANRVSQIQQLTQINKWYHVNSIDNPADFISRGINPKDLCDSTLWWNGPLYLSQDQSYWPQESNIFKFARKASDMPEHKVNAVSLCSTEKEFFNDLCARYSSFSKLQRIVALCLRFIDNLKPHEMRQAGKLNISELSRSTQLLVRAVQAQNFAEDIHSLKSIGKVKLASRLKSLNPFLDDNGILRVGGRLKHSELNMEHKHPALLPAKHVLTVLIIRYEHIRNLHPGPQTTLSLVRQRFWPLNGKQTVKSIIKKCIPCFKTRPIPMNEQMGNLPQTRVTPSRAFSVCGVDYAGPFQMKVGRIRSKIVIKSYVCIFVCFSTKAIHIELVNELTTEAFLNALKRFVSRRGLCRRIVSDNATNFHGAKNHLLNEIKLLLQNHAFVNYLTQSNIEWQFIPPRSPHMGGLWESAVRLVKQHLKRVAKNFTFTYEEFYTLLTQIEAVLNSRPIVPLSDSPDDLQALTPGHFLIGEPLVAIPESDLQNVKINHLSRYQHLCKMSMDIWKRWNRDYLHHLQQRTKWRFRKDPSALVGSLVLLIEDNTPPLHWPMGRIIQLHQGPDQLVRVVSVKLYSGVVKRAINKVCLMPIDSNETRLTGE